MVRSLLRWIGAGGIPVVGEASASELVTAGVEDSVETRSCKNARVIERGSSGYVNLTEALVLSRAGAMDRRSFLRRSSTLAAGLVVSGPLFEWLASDPTWRGYPLSLFSEKQRAFKNIGELCDKDIAALIKRLYSDMQDQLPYSGSLFASLKATGPVKSVVWGGKDWFGEDGAGPSHSD